MDEDKLKILITIIGSLILCIIIYIFWEMAGSKKSIDFSNSFKREGSSPTSLQFKSPFEYDNAKKPSNSDAYKKREEWQKENEGKVLPWK